MRDNYVQVFKELKRLREEREELSANIYDTFKDIKIFCQIPLRKIRKYMRPIKKNWGRRYLLNSDYTS